MIPVLATLTTALLLFCTSMPAYAYLDPGTGSILLQGLIAAIAASTATVSLYWSRIKSFFGKGDSPVEGKPEDEPSEDKE